MAEVADNDASTQSIPKRGSGRTNQPQAPVRKAGAFPCTGFAYLPEIETAPAADKHSTHQQGLAIGLAYTSRNARAGNTRKPLNGRRGRRIPASAPFRPSCLRGETVSVNTGFGGVTTGYFGMAPLDGPQPENENNQRRCGFLFIAVIAARGFESPPLRHPERSHTTRYLKYPSLSNWSTMLVSTNEAGSAVAAFGVVPLIARRVFLMESALGLGLRSAHLAKIW